MANVLSFTGAQFTESGILSDMNRTIIGVGRTGSVWRPADGSALCTHQSAVARISLASYNVKRFSPDVFTSALTLESPEHVNFYGDYIWSSLAPIFRVLI